METLIIFIADLLHWNHQKYDIELIVDIFGLFIFVTFVCCLSYFVEKQKKNTRLAIKALGLDSATKKDFKQWAHLKNFSILRRMGLFSMKSDYFLGRYHGEAIGLFRFILPRTKTSAKEHAVTVIALEKNLPIFILRPEGLRDTIKSRLGFSDINFPEDAPFSRQYFLQGRSENQLRILFNSRLRTKILSTSTNLWIESDGTRLLMVWQNRSQLTAKSVETTLTRAIEIKNILTPVMNGKPV